MQLSATRPLNVEPLAINADIAPHDHDYYEICLMVRGRVEHEVAAGRQRLRPGSVVVVPPGGVHAFWSAKDVQVINVYYLAEWLAAGLSAHGSERGLVPLFLAQALFRREWATRPTVFELGASTAAAVTVELTEIREELAASCPSPLFVRTAFLKLLVRLARAAAVPGDEFSTAVRAVLNDIDAVVEHNGRFDLPSVLRTWPVSADHASRLFREATGFSPLEYYQRRRVQQASARLLDGSRTVTEVALALGFADAAHFSRAFSKYAGLTPRAYRQKYGVGGKRT
ncbi:helix-turn-helix transcriptional regulator [Horticoccus luteus]|uniref:Helix-turn-helix transcriptional regulator n=1 Tax=Horticoccus luteus TaxID=2862869 RepID=A0A8F9TUM9_9BACT|nr:AraC family transcriptional regulator [Horticoccus luteus]QYM78402.1 helix-turn-helix transcriptional regulator [Horticoccus luteus]